MKILLPSSDVQPLTSFSYRKPMLFGVLFFSLFHSFFIQTVVYYTTFMTLGIFIPFIGDLSISIYRQYNNW